MNSSEKASSWVARLYIHHLPSRSFQHFSKLPVLVSSGVLERLLFEVSGNRNATLKSGNPSCKKHKEVAAASLSHLLSEYGDPKIDYIKFDVEGAEREAIEGCLPVIKRDRPALLVSLYHRREDLFALPLYLSSVLEGYDFYLRRFRYIPAWDLNLYAIPRTDAEI